MTFTIDDVLLAANTLDGEQHNPQHIIDGEPRCRYAYPDNLTEPSCLVGHIANLLDPLLFAEIASTDRTAHSALQSSSFGFTSGALDLLQDAQNYADDQLSWGEALWHAQQELT